MENLLLYPVTNVAVYETDWLHCRDFSDFSIRQLALCEYEIKGDEFLMEIEYQLVGSKVRQREPLSKGLFHELQPNSLQPMREMLNSHWKSNKPGLQYFESTRQLVAFESRLEGFNLLLLDWEANTVAIQGQPFTLHYKTERKARWHTPDFLASHSDGTVSVVNVKETEKLSDPKVEAQFTAASAACNQIGWQHRVMGTPTPELKSNLQLLAGFRRPPEVTTKVVDAVRDELSEGPREFGDVAAIAAARTGLHVVLVRPVLLHALWTRNLTANLNKRLTHKTQIAWQEG